MGNFLEGEKRKQTQFKLGSDTISVQAKVDGLFKGTPRPFCLPPEFAEDNLYPSIREAAIDFFTKHNIGWHQGQDGKPSNHLCSSQVDEELEPRGVRDLLLDFCKLLDEILRERLDELIGRFNRCLGL